MAGAADWPCGWDQLTRYRLIEKFGDQEKPVGSLVECRLETGRTHQIRVHLAHIGHPLLGDLTYGSGFKASERKLPEKARSALKSLNRQALHAATLGFEHPVTGKPLRFESPAPDDLASLTAALTGD